MLGNFVINMKKKNQKKSGVGVTPLGDRVLVREISEHLGETKSGIIIPETVSEDKGYKRGKVVAVGNGRVEGGKRVPMEVGAGDTVIFQWGELIKINGEEYHIVSESNILAVIN
jgi:chaperonin GroES